MWRYPNEDGAVQAEARRVKVVGRGIHGPRNTLAPFRAWATCPLRDHALWPGPSDTTHLPLHPSQHNRVMGPPLSLLGRVWQGVSPGTQVGGVSGRGSHGDKALGHTLHALAHPRPSWKKIQLQSERETRHAREEVKEAKLFFVFLGFEMSIIIHIVLHMLRLPCLESENFREITRGRLRSPWAKKFFLSLKPVVVADHPWIIVNQSCLSSGYMNTTSCRYSSCYTGLLVDLLHVMGKHGGHNLDNCTIQEVSAFRSRNRSFTKNDVIGILLEYPSLHDDSKKFEIHRQTYSTCFIKFYFLPYPEQKFNLNLSWKNIFFSENLLSNLNRISDFTVIITTMSRVEIISSVAFPWTFLSPKMLLYEIRAFHYFNPSPHFVYNPRQDSIFTLCLHCREKAEMLRLIDNKNTANLRQEMWKNWKTVNSNFHQHSVLLFNANAASLTRDDCALYEISNRVIASTCCMIEIRNNLNFTADAKDENIEKQAVISYSNIYYVNYRAFEGWSFKKMRTLQERYDVLHVHSKIDHFSYALILDGNLVGKDFNVISLTKSFHWKVWGSLILCGVMTAVTMAVLLKENWAGCLKMVNSLGFALFSVYSSLLEQQVIASLCKSWKVKQSAGTSDRGKWILEIPTVCWIFLALGYSNLYKMVVMSIIVTPVVIVAPKNLNELVNSDLDVVTTRYKELYELIKFLTETIENLNVFVTPNIFKLLEKFDDFDEDDETNWFHVKTTSQLFTESLLQKLVVNNRTVSKEKLIILDFHDRLVQMGQFMKRYFPSYRLIMNVARPMLTSKVMGLYEAGVYEKWQEYYYRSMEYGERMDFRGKYDCENGNNRRILKRTVIEFLNGFGFLSGSGSDSDRVSCIRTLSGSDTDRTFSIRLLSGSDSD
ncbi:hypothetical protein Fcan01_11138 [Folsomia candida]|uniref:Uncharacterized protein n=1 Tax=Folsomia candida TaxID=158441 RepID=A0A226E8K4_FOLCA|nr:hypothetical protein Fcan01_11138 [Folsomia candida]